HSREGSMKNAMAELQLLCLKGLKRSLPVALASLLTVGPVLPQQMAPAQSSTPKPPGVKTTNAKGAKTKAPAKLTAEQRTLHLLDRATFGPRPGDVERVLSLGATKFLEEQLYPEKLTDTVAEDKLKGLESIRMTNDEIAASYPQPQVLREALRAKGIELPDQQGLNAGQNSNPNQNPTQNPNQMQNQNPGQPPGPPGADPEQRRKIQAVMRELGYRPQNQIVQELQQAKILRAVYSERQLQEVMTDFWFNHFNVFAQKGADRVLITSYERDVIRPNVFGKFEDLLRATAKSPAMLFYLDNWLSASPDARGPQRRPGAGRPGQPGEIGQGRPGGFPGPRPDPRQNQARPRPGQQLPDRMTNEVGQRQQPGQMQVPPGQGQGQRRRGLNENYAREVMELHTLGVEGGYTQKDVQEVARCFAGWSIRDPRRGAEFIFNRAFHDENEKTVLGTKIPSGGGMSDGEAVIKLLAHHPSTAKFISTKLARKFVSDTPPQSLIDRLAEIFTKSDGDIREVLRALFSSPEFLSPESFRAKIKTPFEMTVSAVRALGADTNGGPAFHRWTAQMGEPLFLAQPPTGYADNAEMWVNTGALLERMNFGLALLAGKIPGTRVEMTKLAPPANATTAAAVTDHYIKLLLRGQVSAQTRATLDKSLASTEVASAAGSGANQIDRAKIVGLILGSPEFQRQ
ncbi:MAG: DUF1800 family protein, partial [Acidobacteriota bacterium]